MSGKLMSLCFSLVLSRVQRDVLQALSDHANDDGTGAFPSVAYLAWKTDLSERQTKRVLKELTAMKLINRTAYAHGGRGRTPHYRIYLEAGTLKTPFESRTQKGDTQMSPFQVKKGDISMPKRVTSANGKGDISRIKGDTQMSPDPSVRSVSRTTTHTRAREGISHNGNGSVCVISLARLLAYARTQPTIRDPEIWANQAQATRKWDARVLKWEQEQKAKRAATREQKGRRRSVHARLKDFEAKGEVCPKCYNTGTEIIEGKARPCDHKISSNEIPKVRSRKTA